MRGFSVRKVDVATKMETKSKIKSAKTPAYRQAGAMRLHTGRYRAFFKERGTYDKLD
jgi:hypothetical protein